MADLIAMTCAVTITRIGYALRNATANTEADKF